MAKTIIIGSDHAGFELKAYLNTYLKENGYAVVDVGTYSTESCDYPDIASALVQEMEKSESQNCLGVLICGSGIGMSIAVNRYVNMRGALIYNTEVAKLSREHNNANVAILGARMFDKEENLDFLKLFLETDFSWDERHKRRIAKLGR